MPCANCSREFSLFHREYACPACGFSHCASCLKYKVQIFSLEINLKGIECRSQLSLQVVLPKTGKQDKVCQKCQNSMTAPRQVPPPSPPRALQQRLEKLQPTGIPKGLSAEDQRIAERLERLHKVIVNDKITL